MGTQALYHSPAVAGITALSLLAPFREVIQNADGGRWKFNSALSPKPLLSQSQVVLHQMRHLSSDCHVNVYKIIEELHEADESFEDVKSFWEVYRRGLELELQDDDEAIVKLASIFDVAGAAFPMISIAARESDDIQQGISGAWSKSDFRGGLPNFMPVLINRQEFDSKTREWKLHHDRVKLNDHLDTSKWCTDANSGYTLYGFMVHVGSRSSGKFYCVLRPGGPNTKWLAFEDGNVNKVLSYTKHRIQEFEGLESDELRKFAGGRENAYMALYIRDSCFSTYCLPTLEPYNAPSWLSPWTDRCDGDTDGTEQEGSLSDKTDEATEVELYLDEGVLGCENVFSLHELRLLIKSKGLCHTFKVAHDKTFDDLRQAIGLALQIKEPRKIGIWRIRYHPIGRHSNAELASTNLTGHAVCLWVSLPQMDDASSSYKSMLHRLDEIDLSQMNTEDKISVQSEGTGTVIALTESTSAASPTGNDLATHVAQVEVLPPVTTEDTAGSPTSLNGENGQQSAVDIEQESVREAVNRDIGQSVEPVEGTPTEGHASVQPERLTNVVVDQGNITDPEARNIEQATTELSGTPVSNQGLSSDPMAEPPLPVEHGHLIDAVEEHGAEGSAGTEDESSEPDETTAGTSQADLVGNDEEPSIPAQSLSVYGFIFTFNVAEQKLILQKSFSPELDGEVGGEVTKALGYDKERSIRVWKCESDWRMVTVNLDSVVRSLHLQDGFTFIVGDVLSEQVLAKTRATGDFHQPNLLLRHLRMTKRNHPIRSKTSAQPVEVAEFGGDYYYGPLMKGQYHGDKCLLITTCGHRYEGPLITDLMSGANGKMIYQNGDTYAGDWLDGERHGQGELVEARTGNRYVGGFEHDKRWGEGVTYWKVADEQAAMCQICYGEEIDALFYDCGHVCACVECAKQCDVCPICRKSVRAVVRMYRA